MGIWKPFILAALNCQIMGQCSNGPNLWLLPALPSTPPETTKAKKSTVSKLASAISTILVPRLVLSLMHPTNEVEVFRAQQTLASEAEGNLDNGARGMTNSAIRKRTNAHHEWDRMLHDCDQVRDTLGKAGRAVRCLDQQLARLTRRSRRLGLTGSPLSVRSSCLRYSPLATDYARRDRHCLARTPAPATCEKSLWNSAVSLASASDSGSESGKYQ